MLHCYLCTRKTKDSAKMKLHLKEHHAREQFACGWATQGLMHHRFRDGDDSTLTAKQRKVPLETLQNEFELFVSSRLKSIINMDVNYNKPIHDVCMQEFFRRVRHTLWLCTDGGLKKGDVSINSNKMTAFIS